MGSQARVGIVGASGYGGVQLVRLLTEHPNADLVFLGGHSSAGKPLSEIYPHLSHLSLGKIQSIDIDAIAEQTDIVFLALPNGLALKMAPALVKKGCQVLDLSADYRFEHLPTYEQWYGDTHPDPDLAEQAVYGLPELYRDRISTASLIGCPGCYPTASLLAISPLLKQGLIEPNSVIIDAKSGTSGGGRQGKLNLLHAEAEGTLGAYGVARHRHTPEIEQICSALAGREVMVQFTPHLVPMTRGILATVYATLRDPGLVTEDLLTIFNVFYRHSQWVKVLPSRVYPQTKWAWGTNLCYLGIEVDQRTGRVVVMSAIDNLIKGQAGQAVQCMNVMRGWPEETGLPKLSFYP
jgi:N-acetyl-gamma-glutamyl-phosphate reductase